MSYQSQFTGNQVDHILDLINKLQEIPGSISSSLIGYRFVGVANHNTDPLDNDKIFYLASTPGIYSNFNSSSTIEVLPSELAVLLKSGSSWTKLVIYQADSTVNSESSHAVQSKAVFNEYKDASKSEVLEEDDIEVSPINTNPYVAYNLQSLTESQQTQARQNINALGVSDVVNDLDTDNPSKPLASGQGKLLYELLKDGYLFKGVADLNSIPGTPIIPVVYLAAKEGNYPYFNLTVNPGEIALFNWNLTSWSKEVICTRNNSLEGKRLIFNNDGSISWESLNP